MNECNVLTASSEQVTISEHQHFTGLQSVSAFSFSLRLWFSILVHPHLYPYLWPLPVYVQSQSTASRYILQNW